MLINRLKCINYLRINLTIVLISLSLMTSNAQTLRIAVAANAQFVTQALKKSFIKQDSVKIEIIVSSSGKLTAQIMNGAPYDIFMSADMKYPQTLYKNGKTLNKPKIYAKGKLVLWTMKDISYNKELKVLNNPLIKTIAVANPATAPYGMVTISALKRAGIYKQIKNKIVYGESIAQVNQYLLTGVADIAFTGKSVVLSPRLIGKGYWKEIPNSLYQPIQQGVVILQNAKRSGLKEAEAFYRFLFSKTGKDIFRKFGYRTQ